MLKNQSTAEDVFTQLVDTVDQEMAADSSHHPEQTGRPAQLPPPALALTASPTRSVTVDLPLSTLDRLKRATHHQALASELPSTMKEIVDSAINAWCDQRGYK